MEEIQHFRLSETTEILAIPCDYLNGQNVIYWKNIEMVFPGVQYLKHGNTMITKLRDSDGKRIKPLCIRHYPGESLDVQLTDTSSGVNSAAAEQLMAPLLSELQKRIRASTNTRDAHTPVVSESLVETSIEQLVPYESKESIRTIMDLVHKNIELSSGNNELVSEIMDLADLNMRLESENSELMALIKSQEAHAAKQAEKESVPEYRLIEVQKMMQPWNQPPDPLALPPYELHAYAMPQPVSKNNELAFKDIGLASENNELVAKNNELVSKIMENKELLVNLKDLQKVLGSEQDEMMELQKHTLKLQETLKAKQDEMARLQNRALDRLVLVQNNVNALLIQTFELHEYPIPRLFIVLPDDSSSWNPKGFFSTKFRLYFLCECGEHTKTTNSKIPPHIHLAKHGGYNSRIPHHIHLAKHGGYDIERPKEFFEKYGFYVLTILRMLKFGLSVAGIVVPALPLLIPPEVRGRGTWNLGKLRNLMDTVELGVNQVINFLEGGSTEAARQMGSNEALEGADLRQLESFLKNKDESRVLGNLYRTVTTEGHVKWVCIDHFRKNYHEKAAIVFRGTLGVLRGTFDENTGRVEVALQSRIQAEQFYTALEKARSVYELKLHLDWDTTQRDFKKLKSTLPKTRVGVLELDLGDTDGPASDVLNRRNRYDPILGIMRHPSIQSIAIRGPRNFSKRSNIHSRKDDFPTLRHLELSLDQLKDDIPGFQCLISNAPNLSSLTLRMDPLGRDHSYAQQAYNAIAEHQTYPIDFKEWGITIPPPRGMNQFTEWVEPLFSFFRNGSREGLDVDALDELTVNALAEATDSGSGFKKLYLIRDDRLGDPFINNISRIVGRSKLSDITLSTKEDEGRVLILESIQWKHLRGLYICMRRGTFETRVMRVLVDGVMKMSEKAELERFVFWAEKDGTTLTLPQGGLLQDFFSSTIIKDLRLDVEVTVEQMLSLLSSIDVSRMQILKLWAHVFDTVAVDAILERLEHAAELCHLHLVCANITDEQKSRMKARGVFLSEHRS